MDPITDLAALHALYGTPAKTALAKVTPGLTPAYRAFLHRARFCILTTVGPEGTDGSPRGDEGPVVAVLDDHTLAMPDWKGNERIDSLRNIVRDGRASLLFLIPGSKTTIRVNGTAMLTADPTLRARFARGDTLPRSVILLRISEVYSQCARAIVRAELWTGGDQSAGLPSTGTMMQDATSGEIDAVTYDTNWPGRATNSMW